MNTDHDARQVTSVLVMLRDGTKFIVADAYIAGVWDDHLAISGDPQGTGLDFDVDRTIPLTELRRAEVLRRDPEGGQREWLNGW